MHLKLVLKEWLGRNSKAGYELSGKEVSVDERRTMKLKKATGLRLEG